MEKPQPPRHILVAEDDPVMVKLLEFTLRREHYTVTVCREGDAVADKARSEKPDLVLVDYVLPGMTGGQIAQEFHNDPELCKIPIIVVTGQGKDGLRDDLLALGVREVFTKPFSPMTLLAEIKKRVN